MNLRSAVILAIYDKALRLSPSARQQKSVGQIVNLMSTDAQRMQDLTTYLMSLWSAPLQVGICLYFLYDVVGLAMISGVAMSLVMAPVTGYVAKFARRYQKKLMTAKDERIALTGEVLNGIKLIKCSTWEDRFEARIQEVRDVAALCLPRVMPTCHAHVSRALSTVQRALRHRLTRGTS